MSSSISNVLQSLGYVIETGCSARIMEKQLMMQVLKRFRVLFNAALTFLFNVQERRVGEGLVVCGGKTPFPCNVLPFS